MKQFGLNRFTLTLLAFFLSALPATSAESQQHLLTELANPNTPADLLSSPPALIAPDYQSATVPAKLSPAPLLQSLEELRTSGEEAIGLPEADLPVSDIPLTLNSKVEYFLNYFQTKGRKAFSSWLSRSSRYIPMMKEILKSEGLPEDLVYVAMIESGFQLHARSWASAVGPWQFIPGTGRNYDLRIDQWIDERKDPVKSTTAAAIYLKELHGIFNGNWHLATAGYNAGENKILRAIRKYNSNDFWKISKGSYLKRETKEYVPKLLAAALIAKEPARYGFNDIEYLTPIEYDTVTIPSRTNLDLAAKLTGTTYEFIKELNPDLRHWCTPPNYPDYQLKIPKGSKEQFELEYAKIPEDERFTERLIYSHYKVRKKDTLKSVARRFGISPAILAELNGLGRKSRISGKVLIVPARQSVEVQKKGRSTKSLSAKKNSHKYYIIQSGDTLSALSKRFNVPTKLLYSWNNLKEKVTLKPGQRIIISKLSENNGKVNPAGSNG